MYRADIRYYGELFVLLELTQLANVSLATGEGDKRMQRILFLALVLALAVVMTMPVFADDTQPPVISQVNVTPALAAAGSVIHIRVAVTDNIGVTAVSADSYPLVNTSQSYWEGDILAAAGYETHSVNIVANDAANNTATNTSGVYKTAEVVGISNERINSTPAFIAASSRFIFKVWGTVTDTAADSFMVSDSGNLSTKVMAPGHCLNIGDYVTAWGILDPSSTPAVLNSAQFYAINPTHSIYLNDINVGKDLQTSLTGSLSTPAPAEGLDVTLISSDPTRLRLSDTANSLGRGSITFTIPSYMTALPTFYLQGLDSSGTVYVFVNAPGAYKKLTVNLRPSGFIIYNTADFTTTRLSSDSPIKIASCMLIPGTLKYDASQPLRAGIGTISVPVTSSDISIGKITTSPVTIAAVAQFADTAFHPLADGSTQITAGVPSGFNTPSDHRQITATVKTLTVSCSDVAVGKDLQVGVNATLSDTPNPPVNVTITTASDTIATVSKDPNTDGSSSITYTGVISTNIGPFYVQGKSIGTTNLTISVAGCDPVTKTITVNPSGFMISNPSVDGSGAFSTKVSLPDTTVTITSAMLNATTFAYVAPQNLRAGIANVSVPVTSSNQAVGTITTSPVTFTANSGSISTNFHPVGTGSSDISITTPAGFTTSSTLNKITANVTAGTITASDVSVGKDLQVRTTIYLNTTPQPPTDVTITVGSNTTATLSKDPSVEGAGSITFNAVSGTSVGPFYIQGRSQGTTSITISAPGYTTSVKTITVNPSGFRISSPSTSFNTYTVSPDTTVQINSAMLTSTLAYSADQPLRGGLSDVSIDVSSSNTAVGTITSSPVIMTASNGSATTSFHPKSAGSSQIAIATPTGFSTLPSSYRQITATISMPNITSSDVSVGKDLQVAGYASLGTYSSVPVDVTISVGSSSVATLSKNMTDEGTNSITFTGIAGTSVGPFYIQGISMSTTTLTVSAPGYNSVTKNITVNPSGFVILSPSSIITKSTSANTNITIASAMLNPSTLNYSQTQNIRGGMQNVNVPVTSSNTAIGTITVSPVVFSAGIASLTTQFDPAAQGSCTVSVGAVEGFSTPNSNKQINVTVNP